MKIRFFKLFFLLSFPGMLHSQSSKSPDYAGYIATYKDIAIREMKIYHIPASISLAQGIIESSCGNSPLATEANNHFGIKCHKDWGGETYYYDDDEKQECFRKYASADESYRDHSLFLVNKQRYAALFSLDLTDYTGWAMGLKQAGYATNPEYPRLLIHMIEMNRLDQYDDTVALQKVASTENQKEVEENSLTVENKRITHENCMLFDKHYVMPDPANYTQINVSKLGRIIYENNGIPCIFVKKGDTWYGLASEFSLTTSQLFKENDMEEADKLSIGQILYLEAKKRKSFVKTHVFKEYETVFSVSQFYGIKLSHLYRYNHLKSTEVPLPGQILHLTNPIWNF
ncbi:MAG: glucosaminidase domain-containing protein [Bacteroidetes bacterium]|nr:glucosaminidase domain-containing protein [Bacteroidota bacterium]